MSIPLINEVNKNDINTSIIAIKKNIERINTLLGLNNTEEIDTSIFATKEELEQAEADLAPVDEVTLDNMQSVTSNAVAEAINGGEWETVDDIAYKRIGNIVFVNIDGNVYFDSAGDMKSVSTGNYIVIPQKYRPKKYVHSTMAYNATDVIYRLRIYPDTGRIRSWNLGSIVSLPTGSSAYYWQSTFCYCID